jgi:hypothetical protein
MGRLNIHFAAYNGLEFPPMQVLEARFIANFDDDNIQPNLAIEEITIANQYVKIVQGWIETFGFFDGMPITISFDSGKKANGDPGGLLLYTGCIDFVSGYKVLSPVKIQVKIKLHNGLNLLNEQAEAISFGYLSALEAGVAGRITNEDYVDVPVIIRKKFDLTETAIAALLGFIVGKELYETRQKIVEEVNKKIHTLLEAPLSKPAAVFMAIADLLLFIAYKALVLVQLYVMIKTIKNNLAGRKTIYKGITLRTLLQRACDYLKLELDCDIPEIDNYVYLPSKNNDKTLRNKRLKGIPGPSDFGYNVSEIFQLVNKLFYARRKRKRNKLFIRAANSNFWDTNAGYVMTNVLNEPYRFNLDEMSANRIVSMQYDPSDEWTMPSNHQDDDYSVGTNYEVITQLAHFNDSENNLLKGLDEVQIPLALGKRRDKLSAFEQSLKVIFATADVVIELFGGKPLKEEINEHKGALQISHNSFNTAKLIYLSNGLIPANHRDLLSARALYLKYHSYKSFKTSPTAQRRIYEGIRLPFDFEDMMKTIESSYFTTSDGKKGKFTEVTWKIGDNYADMNYWVAEQYEKNIIEKPIET